MVRRYRDIVKVDRVALASLSFCVCVSCLYFSIILQKPRFKVAAFRRAMLDLITGGYFFFSSAREFISSTGSHGQFRTRLCTTEVVKTNANFEDHSRETGLAARTVYYSIAFISTKLQHWEIR